MDGWLRNVYITGLLNRWDWAAADSDHQDMLSLRSGWESHDSQAAVQLSRLQTSGPDV